MDGHRRSRSDSISWHTGPGVEMQFIGSEVEFDDVLSRAAELKSDGKKIAGNLDLSVFGVKQPCP